ncbi:MAG: hypothetical protein JO153_07770 [Solirubrobacterales bacterium]|nr:hypothetical protein [Solirubrobacterales bacterium]
MSSETTPEEYFEARGFAISFSDGDGFVWADLTRGDSGAVLPRYGRGEDEASAAARAVVRWRVEQGD